MQGGHPTAAAAAAAAAVCVCVCAFLKHSPCQVLEHLEEGQDGFPAAIGCKDLQRTKAWWGEVMVKHLEGSSQAAGICSTLTRVRRVALMEVCNLGDTQHIA